MEVRSTGPNLGKHSRDVPRGRGIGQRTDDSSGQCRGGKAALSTRELDVVHFLVQGLTNTEIARQLQLSKHTVKNHLFRIFDHSGAGPD